MPHYMDGTEAKIGDQVIGKGYNVPHTISGVVVGITPGAKTCNIQVAHTRQRNTYGDANALAYPVQDVEYGEAAKFERADLHAARLAREIAPSIQNGG